MWERYRRVWRAPHVGALMVASVLARVPIGIVSLALILFVEDVKGSFAAAGGVTAAFALSAALLAPVMGRLIDRQGQTRVLLAGVTIHAAALVGLVALGLADAPLAALVACAAAAGTAPPISAALRPLWSGLLGADEELRTAAYALDSILLEAVFVLGPLLTGVLVALFSPEVALLAAAGLAVVGTLWFAAQQPSRAWRGEEASAPHRAGPLVRPGMRTLVVASFGFGIAFGALEVSLAAYGTERGQPSLSGILIALQALGSAAGGLWYGAGHQRLGSLQRSYLVLMAAAGPLIALIAAAPSVGVIVPLAILSGCVLAPLTAAENLLVSTLAPAGTLTEAFTWVITATVVGVAVGNAMAGVIVDAASWRAAILAACAVTTAGAAVAFARRRTLSPA